MAFASKVGSLLKQSGGKHISTGLSSSNSPFFQAIRSMSSAKLFVGGLAYATDEVGLRQAFQHYGDVIEAKVITDRDSGRSRGFGFVSYTSADAANSALHDMDGKELHGRRIRVTLAQERPRPSFGGGGYGGPGGYGDRRNNLDGYDGRNQNAGGGGDLFSGVLRGASRVSSPGGGSERDVDGDLNHDLSGTGGRVDFEDADYANTSNK